MKNNWKEEFDNKFLCDCENPNRECYQDNECTVREMRGDLKYFIESLLEKQKKELMEECINIVKGVESYCIQPTGYCNEEKEKEIYLHGFDDMRVFKLIKLLSLRDKLNHHD